MGHVAMTCTASGLFLPAGEPLLAVAAMMVILQVCPFKPRWAETDALVCQSIIKFSSVVS